MNQHAFTMPSGTTRGAFLLGTNRSRVLARSSHGRSHAHGALAAVVG